MKESRRWDWESALVLGGLALAVAGCLGPWVDHEAAGLALTGLELGEFAKPFPHVVRSLLYVPFATALVGLALVVGGLVERKARLLVPPACALLILVSLFPYDFVTSAFDALTAGSPLTVDSRYTGQAVVAIVGVVLALLAPLS